MEFLEDNNLPSRIVFVTCLCLLGIFGIFGNILTAVFYTRTVSSASLLYVRNLAFSDTIVSVLMILNAAEIVFPLWTYPVLCKVSRFLAIWTITVSGIFIWLIAEDRHKKICRPFKEQMGTSKAKKVCAVVTISGCAFASRVFWSYDVLTVSDYRNKTQLYQYCTTREDQQFGFITTMNNVIDFSITFVGWINICVLYVQIARTLCDMKKRRTVKYHVTVFQSSKSSKTVCEASCNETYKTKWRFKTHDTVSGKSSQVSDCAGLVNPVGDTQMTSNDSSMEESVICKPTDEKQTAITHITAETPETSALKAYKLSSYYGNVREGVKETKKQSEPAVTPRKEILQSRDTLLNFKPPTASNRREKRLTLGLLSISLIFIICFTPYFFVKIYLQAIRGYGVEIELYFTTQVFLRLAYVNSIINPYIYFIFNLDFRKFVKKTICCLKHRYKHSFRGK